VKLTYYGRGLGIPVGIRPGEMKKAEQSKFQLANINIFIIIIVSYAICRIPALRICNIRPQTILLTV
jgi:hypothetical protein